MKKLYTATILIITLFFSCEEKAEEPVKECTDPNFGELVTATYGFRDGTGFIHISKVWGSFDELTYEWDHGATGPKLEGLSPDIYTVTITNTEGCSVREEYDLRLDDADSEGYSIGDTGPAGGIVFQVNEDGSGLEAAPIATIWTNKIWGCEGMEISTMQAMGTGQANTNNIVNNCGESDIAAKLCDELEVNGFDDWYLPSINELSSLGYVIYQEELSGYPNGNYWSSSEAIATMAYREYLPDGGSEVLKKGTGANVIAIRSF